MQHVNLELRIWLPWYVLCQKKKKSQIQLYQYAWETILSQYICDYL